MRKTAAHRLDEVRAVLAATMAQLAEKEGERNGALLADKDAIEIGKIDAEIATLRHAARTENDRIRLLEIEVTKEKQAAGVRQRQGHITRFAKLLAASVADAEEVEELAEQLLKTVRRCISRRERALVGFNVKSSHANAAARAIEGAALSGDAVMAHLAGHFYKISAQPLLGGRPGARTEPSLPGAKCPRLDWTLTPEKIHPSPLR